VFTAQDADTLRSMVAHVATAFSRCVATAEASRARLQLIRRLADTQRDAALAAELVEDGEQRVRRGACASHAAALQQRHVSAVTQLLQPSAAFADVYVHWQIDGTLQHTRDVLRSVAAAGGDRAALFRRASAAARDLLGATYGQLFALTAVDKEGVAPYV
jgi:hypothetical protein